MVNKTKVAAMSEEEFQQKQQPDFEEVIDTARKSSVSELEFTDRQDELKKALVGILTKE